MKKRILITTLFILTGGMLFFIGCQKKTVDNHSLQVVKTKVVSKALARKVATKFNSITFFGERNHSNYYMRKIFSPTGNNKIENEITYFDGQDNPAFYVCNFADSAGSLIVSADFNLEPILAYIPHGIFSKTDKKPEGLTNWINRSIENVEIVRKGLYDNSRAAHTAWNTYIKEYNVKVNPNRYPLPPLPPSSCDDVPPDESLTVGPLLATTWGQKCTFNDSCDLAKNYSCSFYPCNDTRPATGCIATAMAQIIRYYEYPSGYNYASMPNASGNSEVEKLMRDAGESVNMDYGCESGAYGNAIPDAFKNTFGYSSANRWSYSASNSDYNRIFKNIRDSLHPVMLEGKDKYAGGHEWVCDGVHTRTDYVCIDGKLYIEKYLPLFHMNWGWHDIGVGNDYNGWYGYDDWSIPQLNLDFKYYQYAETEIHP